MEIPPSFIQPQNPLLPPPTYRVRLDAIGEAWALIRQDIWPWVVVVLLTLVVVSVVQLPMQIILMPTMIPANPASPQVSSVPFQTLALSPFMFMGLGGLSLVIAAVQGLMNTLRKLRGESATVNDMFSFDGQFWRVALWWILFPVIAGLVPLLLMFLAVQSAGGFSSKFVLWFSSPVVAIAYIVSMLWFLAAQSMFAFTPLLIVDQGLTVIDAAKLSVRTLARNILPMFGVVFVCAAFLTALGVCACYVGIFVTGSLQFVTIGVIYNDFFRRVAPPSEGPGGYYPRPGPMWTLPL